MANDIHIINNIERFFFFVASRRLSTTTMKYLCVGWNRRWSGKVYFFALFFIHFLYHFNEHIFHVPILQFQLNGGIFMIIYPTYLRKNYTNGLLSWSEIFYRENTRYGKLWSHNNLLFILSPGNILLMKQMVLLFCKNSRF